jgi:hypothetical protein
MICRTTFSRSDTKMEGIESGHLNTDREIPTSTKLRDSQAGAPWVHPPPNGPLYQFGPPIARIWHVFSAIPLCVVWTCDFVQLPFFVPWRIHVLELLSPGDDVGMVNPTRVGRFGWSSKEDNGWILCPLRWSCLSRFVKNSAPNRCLADKARFRAIFLELMVNALNDSGGAHS